MKRLTAFPVFRRAPKQRPVSPPMKVRLTVERMQGTTVTSYISGTGDDIEEALMKALGRSKNMSRELTKALATMRKPEYGEGGE